MKGWLVGYSRSGQVSEGSEEAWAVLCYKTGGVIGRQGNVH